MRRVTRPYVRASYVEEDCGYSTPCWIWRGYKDRGYGQIRINKKLYKAHVYYYEQQYGAVPEGLELDHLCRNHSCVNPDHLEPVTSAINTRRGSKAKLTAELVAVIRARGTDPGTYAPLAEEYGVSRATIYRIVHYQLWKTPA